MAKVNQGRLDGVYGMEKFTATELFALADEYDQKINNPENTDDAKWLKRRSDRLRLLAEQKEKAMEHKESQKKP